MPQPANVSDDAQLRAIASWIEKGNDQLAKPKDPEAARPAGFADAEAKLRFARAVLLLELGRPSEATADLKRALTRDPDNWLIHKQIWAIEHPDRFYDGRVDFRWQRAQLERERRVGKSDGA